MTEPSLDRRDLLTHLFPYPDRHLFISGLAGAARDAAALTGDGANLFTMAGTMGAAVSMGLGVALSAPEKPVAVITGDGELLMNIGSLATVATIGPVNLTIVCIDNGRHSETGGQAGHTSGLANLEMIARGTGMASTMTISCPNQLADAMVFLADTPSPRFLVACVTVGPPTTFKRNMDPAACRLRFRAAYLASN